MTFSLLYLTFCSKASLFSIQEIAHKKSASEETLFFNGSILAEDRERIADFDRLANLILDYGRKVDFSRLSRPCTILADQYALEAIYTLNGVFYGESDSTFVIFDRLLQWSVVISSANESDVQELKGIDKAGLGVVYSSLLSTLE